MELEVDANLGVDLATKADVEALARLNAPPFVESVQRGYSQLTDGNGNLSMRVYDVEDGKFFALYKVLLFADGFTPASPFSGASAWLGIYHGNPGPLGQLGMANLADFAPSSPGGQLFPSTFEYGDAQAPKFKAPDNVGFGLVNGPANTNITVMLFGELRSITVRARPETPIKTPHDRFFGPPRMERR